MEQLLWSCAKLGHVLFPNGDGWESGSETDVHESCQPLPITNATSLPPWQNGGRGGGAEAGERGGVEVTDRTCDPIVATPAVSPPLPPDHRHLCRPHPANWPMLPHMRAHTSARANTEQNRRTFTGALSCSCVMIDKCFKTPHTAAPETHTRL